MIFQYACRQQTSAKKKRMKKLFIIAINMHFSISIWRPMRIDTMETRFRCYSFHARRKSAQGERELSSTGHDPVSKREMQPHKKTDNKLSAYIFIFIYIY